MARKNVFDLAQEPTKLTPASAQPKLGRPLLGLERSIRPASPVGAISQSLENINSRAQRADEIESNRCGLGNHRTRLSVDGSSSIA